MNNLEIEHVLAKAADCDVRTARRALENGFMCVRQGSLRNRIRVALENNRHWGLNYSKEHYP